MKNSIKFFFLICIFFCAISCNKKHTVIIKAVNAVTGEPYSGLPYSIKGTKTASNGEKLVFEHYGTLNANGEASPNIKVNENLALSVGCEQPANTCFTSDISGAWNPKENPNPTFQFEYAECVSIKLDIENINCASPSDKMNFQFRNSYTGFNGWSTDRLGCYSYESDFFEVSAGWIIYHWKVDRNSVLTNFEDSIYIAPNGSGTFIMNY